MDFSGREKALVSGTKQTVFSLVESGEQEFFPLPKSRVMWQQESCSLGPVATCPPTLPHHFRTMSQSAHGSGPDRVLTPSLCLGSPASASPGPASASLVPTTGLSSPRFLSFCSSMCYFSLPLIVLGAPPSYLVIFSAVFFFPPFVSVSSFQFSSSVT